MVSPKPYALSTHPHQSSAPKAPRQELLMVITGVVGELVVLGHT